MERRGAIYGAAVKILIAADSKTNLTIITNTLEKLRHIVMPVTSGEQAIEVFQQISPDLIILDVVMNR
jgi:CheY-like chemotaxis protein